MIEPKIYPALDEELLARLTRQATTQNDNAAYRTLAALAGRPKFFKVPLWWPRAKGAGEFEIGVN
jgi:hypothetical protein